MGAKRVRPLRDEQILEIFENKVLRRCHVEINNRGKGLGNVYTSPGCDMVVHGACMKEASRLTYFGWVIKIVGRSV
jgi:hypothetical protein